MAQRSNQDIERHYFNMFCKHYKLPEGTIIFDDKPDVILEGERRIGIEITNFFLEKGNLEESEQKQSVVRRSVVSMAHQSYLDNGGKRIELSLSFDKVNYIQNQKLLVEKITTLAKNIDEFRTGLIHRDVFKNIPELSFVYLNTEEYEDPKWRIVQCYSGQLMSMEKLRAIVSVKEEKSKHYKTCDAYWLVVIVDFSDRSQDQEIQINGFEKITSTAFEKVIIFRTHSNDVLEAK